MRTGGVKGFAHITGGGITENLPRALPEGLDAEVDLSCLDARRRCSAGWRKQAAIAAAEMLRTFNCGIGLVAVVDEKNAGHVIDAFQQCGDKAVRLGKLIPGDGEAKVVYRGTLQALKKVGGPDLRARQQSRHPDRGARTTRPTGSCW